MNRVRLLVFVVLIVPVLLIAASVLLYDSTPIASSPNIHYTSFSVGGKTFELTYLATNQSALQKGLMGVKVTNSTTELFVFPNAGYYSFWMFGVNSSLDMMWVYAPPGSNAGTVVSWPLTRPPVTCPSSAPTTSPRRGPIS